MGRGDEGQQAAASLASLFGLHGQVAIVTGGTGVLGAALAHGLARAGATVVILGRRRERAEAVAAEIAAAGGEAGATPADVLQKGGLEAVREMLPRRWGHIDILVNAARGDIPAATLLDGPAFFRL